MIRLLPSCLPALHQFCHLNLAFSPAVALRPEMELGGVAEVPSSSMCLGTLTRHPAHDQRASGRLVRTAAEDLPVQCHCSPEEPKVCGKPVGDIVVSGCTKNCLNPPSDAVL